MENNSEIDLSVLFTAEFWALVFSERQLIPQYPIEIFKYNILKARILAASSEEVAKFWTPLCEKLSVETLTDVAEVGLFSYYVYTEQALVSSVTASEVYFRDRLAYSINNDKRILKRYKDKNISVGRLIDTGLKLKSNVGNLIAEQLNFQILDQVQEEYRRIYGFEPFSNDTLKELKRIFALRHLIVHNSGIVDYSFLTKINKKLEIGKRYFLQRHEVIEMINYIFKIINGIEEKIIEIENKKKVKKK